MEQEHTSTARSREHVIGDALDWTARWSLRWLLIALGALLVGYIIKLLWVILLPVLLALILTTVLQPPVRVLESKVRLAPALATAVVLLAAIAVIVGFVMGIAPQVVDQSGEIASDASKALQSMQDWMQRSSLNVNKDQIDHLIQEAQSRVTSHAGSIASGVAVGLGAVTSGVITLVITLVLTFFFLKDGRRFMPWLAGFSGRHAGHHLAAVGERAWSTLGGFIRTQALVSLIDAVFIGAALLIVGVPLAIPLAILTFFGGFVPIVGAFVVGALAVLVALVSNGWTSALVILAVILVVQQLEGNVLSPWLQAKSMNLHAAVVLASVTVGSSAFGVVGAFLAVPVVAVVAVALRYLNGLVEEAAGGGAATAQHAAGSREAQTAEALPHQDPDQDSGTPGAESQEE